jgi:hypothetical protein
MKPSFCSEGNAAEEALLGANDGWAFAHRGDGQIGVRNSTFEMPILVRVFGANGREIQVELTGGRASTCNGKSMPLVTYVDQAHGGAVN